MADAPDVKAPGGGGKTVKVFGAQLNKKTLYVGLAVGAGVLGYAYYSKRKNAAASSSTTGTTAADTTGTGTDPATGYPYGSAEDTAALAAQSGDSGLGYNTSGYGNTAIDPNTGIPYAEEVAGLGGGGGSTTTSTTQPVTIAEWEQECIANLEAGGLDQATISNAESGLPRYLAHLTMSSAQGTAVQLAVGLTGPPPSGGPYSIRITPSPPKPPPPAAKVKVPALTGERVENANSALASLGLKSTFGARKPNVPYVVTATSPKAGTDVAKGSTVHLTIREELNTPIPHERL